MENSDKNAIVLGVSSGFGKSAAIELARNGYNIYGVHLDIGPGKKIALELEEELKQFGGHVRFFNVNAADEMNRKQIIESIKEDFPGDPKLRVKVLLHSLAFGSIGPFFSEENPEEETVVKKKLDMTLNVMANSLLYWTQDLFHGKLLAKNSRVLAITSLGSTRAMKNYGAMSVAKAALEALVRQIALELGPYGITCNAIMPGTADTPASQKIPGIERLLEYSRHLNPLGRNTMPEDVANAIVALVDDKTFWINGQTIPVDGGESIVSFRE